MQIALQDLRRLGTLKIGEAYITDRFLEKLKQLNTDCIAIKSSAYSVPKVWSLLDKDALKKYHGVFTFMDTVEPTIDYVGYSEVNQRRFRNMWTRLFHTVAKDLDLDENTEILIRDLGIRLIYYSCTHEVDEDVLKFYNTIIQWYIFSLQETNLEKYKLTVNDLLELLCLSSCEEFSKIVLQRLV